jgi:LacI family transcriptional regulator
MPPRKRKPTLAHVAERAGVSVATASLALSNKGRISPEVRDRINRTADELGYERRPRRPRASGITAVLGIIDQEWAYAWRMQLAILRQMTQRLEQEGRSICVIPVSIADDTDAVLERVRSAQADAVFSIHYANPELFSSLESASIPVVIIMNGEYQTELNSVCADDFRGAYDAGAVLVEAGHRRIAYVSAELPMLAGLRVDRLMGLEKCLDENGIEFTDELQPVVSVHHQDEVDGALRTLMALREPPSALYVMDDYLGVAVLESARRLGLSVPGDLSVICAGDVLDYSEPYVPRISTMSIPFDAMGDAAVSLMARRLSEAGRGFGREVLKVNQVYVDRGSVAAAGTD